MPSQPDSPESLLHQALPYPTPLTAWEQSVLGSETNDPLPDAAGDLLTTVNPHERVWSLGLASEVFLRAGAASTALVAAQKAAAVAEHCCDQCRAWTLRLQADAHQTLSFALLARARHPQIRSGPTATEGKR